MKKTFNLKFFAVSVLLMLGNLVAWAQPGVGTYVGATVQVNGEPGIVTYQVNAAPTTVGGIEYIPVTITGFDADGLTQLESNPDITIEIPVTFNEKNGPKFYNFAVSQIADEAFYGILKIKSLKFTDGTVTGLISKMTYAVGDRAFFGCTNLASLEFNDNCGSIGEYAFQNTAIKDFTIPKYCATIAQYAFYNCQSLNKVEVSASNNAVMTTLNTHVFGNSSLKTLDLSKATALTTLSGAPFLYNLSETNGVLKSVTLPGSVTTIGTAFAKCTALTTINNFENTKVALIADGYFEGCKSLTGLVIPKKTNITGSPFQGCSALTTLAFVPNYYGTIGDGANIYGTTDEDKAILTNLWFKGDFCGTISDGAFVGSTALTEVKFDGALASKNVDSGDRHATIGAAFTDVTSLTALTFAGSNGVSLTVNQPVDINATAFQNTGITALNFKNLAIAKNNTFTIAADAFSNCADLASITFGNIEYSNTDGGAITIASDAFINNDALTAVTFGTTTFNKQGTLTINDAFYNNPLLASVSFGATTFNQNGTVDIVDDAFGTGNAALASVSFGNITTAGNKNSIFRIGSTDFAHADDITANGKFDVGETITAEGTPVFGDGDNLTTVTFGSIKAKTFAVKSNAFASTGLTSVSFGAIDGVEAGSSFDIQHGAFAGGDAADKTVSFQTIKDNGNNALTATIAEDAFAATKLKSVTFGNMQARTINIKDRAFQGANLQTVILGEIKAANGASTFTVGDDAFRGGDDADKTVAIGNISDNGGGKTMTANFGANAFKADKLKSVTINGMNAAGVTIGAAAFQSDNLQTVSLGTIKASNDNNSTVTINANAFQGGNVAAKTVTITKISNSDSYNKTLDVVIGASAFAAPKLETVTISGGLTAKSVDIGASAFRGAGLKTVTLGDIKPTAASNSTVTIGAYAFEGGAEEEKTVTIGNLVDNAGNTLTATIGQEAFAADMLTSVTIGNMTATSLKVDGKAFANTNTVDELDEEISIGTLGAVDFTWDPDTDGDTEAFKGPQADGSTYAVTVAGISGAVKIPAGTFKAAPKGEASYTFTGNIAASLANVAAGAFVGSQENIATPVENTTDVWFQGNYSNDFTVANVFTNVNDLKIAVAADGKTAKTYGVAGDLKAFKDVKTVTVGDIPTGKSIVANTAGSTQKIAEVTFLKNVADANAIDVFNSPEVRKIEFKNVKDEGVKVAEGAVKAGAFQAAYAALGADDVINIIYVENQTAEAKPIFAKTAFAAAKVVAPAPMKAILYTSQWAKANVYEYQDNIDGENQAVYGLAFSESNAIPGEPILAQLAQKPGQQYAYAKLYIPQGKDMKYMVPALYDATSGKNGVQLYTGKFNKSANNLFMYNVTALFADKDETGQYYWIDATESEQVFVVRVNTELVDLESTLAKDEADKYVVAAEAVSAEVEPIDPEFYYFDKSEAVKRNSLKYSKEKISNAMLRSNAEFAGKDVFVMANPATKGFAFVNIKTTDNGDGEYRAIPEHSIYVVGNTGEYAAKLAVFFEGEEGFDDETSLEEINGVETENNEAIYNLQGVRVNKTQKGIYIQNGKKYVVK